MALAVGALIALGPVACSSGSAVDGDLAIPEGFHLEVVSDALDGPTQALVGPDGRWWVAELHGDENAGTGRVVALADDGAVGDVLLDGLDKPTGIAVLDGALWVMQRRSLGQAPIAAEGTVGALQTVLDDLPFNGRSETALTTTSDGRLLYATTGSAPGGDVTDDSGVLWELDPADPTHPHPYGTGFKNAYAHVAVDGAVVTTEIGDGSYDGQAPADELDRIRDGEDAGWPLCIGDRTPVQEYGGSPEWCATTVAPLALFPPRATPTGLAAFDGGWIVALWTRDELVKVPENGGDVVTWVTGLAGPQDLEVVDGVLYVTEHRAGRLLAIAPG